MAKEKTFYRCQECGYQTPKWLGKCPGCNLWDSFVSEVSIRKPASKGLRPSAPIPLSEVGISKNKRMLTGIQELDRPLGGGIVPGSLTLLAGEPGIGKSTILLQISASFANQGHKVIYVSGEESSEQIKMRADRIKCSSSQVFLFSETSVDHIFEAVLREKPALLIVDSVQTVFSDNIPSPPGSLVQVREVTYQFMKMAKKHNISTFLSGHVTKDGAIAGPRVLEHIVDTVLYMEGERYHAFRLLRAVKNRFGSTNEIGVFSMTGAGLEEVPNPSELFLSERAENIPGTTVCACMEGSRPLLVELQFLVSGAGGSSGNPRRGTVGVDLNRMFLLIAVLEKRIGMHMGSLDVFGNAAGGIKVNEPAADLPICMAILSSAYNKPLPNNMAILGEVGLGGEVRGISHVESRISEAAKLGFEEIVIPKSSLAKLEKSRGPKKKNSKNPRIIGVESVSEAMDILFN